MNKYTIVNNLYNVSGVVSAAMVTFLSVCLPSLYAMGVNLQVINAVYNTPIVSTLFILAIAGCMLVLLSHTINYILGAMDYDTPYQNDNSSYLDVDINYSDIGWYAGYYHGVKYLRYGNKLPSRDVINGIALRMYTDMRLFCGASDLDIYLQWFNSGMIAGMYDAVNNSRMHNLPS